MRNIHDLISLEGRVALVTGGAGFIGSEMARALAEVGASVVIIDIDLNRCRKIADGINKE